MKRLFIGMTTAARPEWTSYLAEPQATRSKLDGSKEKEIREKREKQLENAPFYPVTATVTTCVILDQDGKEVFSAMPSFEPQAPGKTAFDAINAIIAALGGEASRQESQWNDIGFRFFGLNVRDRMRILVLDAMQYATTRETGEKEFRVPPGLWYHHHFEPSPFCDPYAVLIPSERRGDISYDSLCRFLGIPIDPSEVIDSDPKRQAELALAIAKQAFLFP